ncbi:MULTISPECIES: helix-turn-helix domain-containing protein [Streptomyces]|uniref:Helix-turn-helix domain-containing protein n=1 Tax=Streptomyces lienomycini TaxID=284035 RepID=A0ABV9WTD8_9ACTN|nr:MULTISPECIES: helix-turn-helix transcriptional regulator [Streptomyces]
MTETPNRPLPCLTHIGLVLEQVRRQADIEHAALANKTGVDIEYVTGVLLGSRFPSRRFILRYARACRADIQVLVRVWEDEHERRLPKVGDRADG